MEIFKLKNERGICFAFSTGSVPEVKIAEQDQNLAFLVMDCLTLLLHDNGDNASKYAKQRSKVVG